MKKLLFLPALALLASACSNENFDGPGDNNSVADDNVARSFLTVSLVSPRSVGGRADNAVYEEGTADENNIEKIRFFFFDQAGNPSKVWKQAAPTNTGSDYLSYIDWYPTQADYVTPIPGNTPGPVEKIVNATLGINMPATAKLPELVLAIVNPTGEVDQEYAANPKLSDITGYVADYYTGLINKNFVMSNSVYAQGGNEVNATPIDTEKNFKETPEEAAENPLLIYVERVLARVDLSIDLDDAVELTEQQGDTPVTYYIYPASESSYTVDGKSQDIYVKFLGWNVVSTPNKSRLIKSIDPSWPNDLFEDGNPWNADNYYRSFWAINPPKNDFEYLYGSFNGPVNTPEDNYQPALTYAMPLPVGKDPQNQNGYVTAYVQENANPYSDEVDDSDEENGSNPTSPSKVILAAQLVDINGKPISLVYWANRYYTTGGVLNAVANTLNLYSLDGDTYTKITPDDLQIVDAETIYEDEMPDDVAPYYAYVQLTKAAEEKDWYNGNSSSATEYDDADAVNEYIVNRVNYLYVWETGYSYYYFNIRHLGSLGHTGYDGVVRNHIYRCNITGLAGLGTPVYDPDEVIYPTVPPYDDNVISAQVRVLQWRVVSQNYDIKWP